MPWRSRCSRRSSFTLGGQQAPETDLPTFAFDTSLDIDEVGERIEMSFEYGQVHTSGGDQAVRQQMQQACPGWREPQGR